MSSVCFAFDIAAAQQCREHKKLIAISIKGGGGEGMRSGLAMPHYAN